MYASVIASESSFRLNERKFHLNYISKIIVDVRIKNILINLKKVGDLYKSTDFFSSFY